MCEVALGQASLREGGVGAGLSSQLCSWNSKAGLEQLSVKQNP